MVGDLIGEGSFGQVFLGKHKTTGKYVAMKVIDKIRLQRSPFLLDAVLLEQRVLRELRECDHVVNLWASFHDEQCMYLVMECATGGDLTHVIRHGMQDPKHWRKHSVPHFGLMILTALEQIHSKGIIHADLKPENILLNSQGLIQLADFGSAFILSSRTMPCDSLQLLEGTTHHVRGTTEYSCPEIIRGMSDLSVSVDLWSLGCIIFTMLVGKSPFHASSEALVVARIRSFIDAYTDIDGAYAYFSDKPPANALEADWMYFVMNLFHPDPLQRLGRLDFVTYSLSDKSDCFVYNSIRSKNIWSKALLTDGPRLLTPEPEWWDKARHSSMRDGSLGWTAFVL